MARKRKPPRDGKSPADEPPAVPLPVNEPATPRAETMAIWSEEEPVDEEAGVSLARLSQAFAQILQPAAPPDAAPPGEGEEPDPRAELAGASDNESPGGPGLWAQLGDPIEPAGEVTVRGIVEAMLFVGHPQNAPLTATQIASLIRGLTPPEIEAAIAELNSLYEAERCAYEIVRDRDGYRLVLREALAPVRDRFYGRLRQARLSQAAIEVLALVAYHEPLTAEDVNRMRNTPSGPVLNQLVQRQLLRIERTDTKPRITTYFTTRRFLSLFQLESLADLPKAMDLDF